jgi:hypothetical protein
MAAGTALKLHYGMSMNELPRADRIRSIAARAFQPY